ncbi:hypothetical protein OOK31_31060 [Streptomyces sp. NBC_00249]|uniref:hypothetical protein n=1 Tax=Streptomyces sp. NBC_00249 TaxID=2975690 RepID=UPI002257C307|nr:hypothetical protein [Streptomyces sp. NBC_00249]MCX5198280.1 hypothetical protein [Streptomyces sp. NBC_00249]
MEREHSEPRTDQPGPDQPGPDQPGPDRPGPDRRAVLAGGLAGAAALTLGAASGDRAAKGAGLLTRVERALGTGTAAYLPGDGWIRLTLPLEDGGAAPVTVDVLADTARAPHGIAYLLPGGGLNFTADFDTPGTPGGVSLARHLLGQGLLVVGVTPREDASRTEDIGPDRGLAAHRRDLAKVVGVLDSVLGLPYQYAGHSAGAALALDAASHDPSPRLGRVLVLDTTGPYTGELALRAARTRDAYEEQLARGVHAADPGLAALIAGAVSDPAAPSAVPWPPDPARRFTRAGLAHFALVRTAALPGPANWIYRQGHSAGGYAFGAGGPAEDRFTLDHTSLTTWHAATTALGSGLVPTALMRDLAAVWAGDEATYRIDWPRIRAEVVWVNTELGRGDEPHGADLIRAGGNTRVRFALVPGYGHGDAVWSATAAKDVWSLF